MELRSCIIRRVERFRWKRWNPTESGIREALAHTIGPSLPVVFSLRFPPLPSASPRLRVRSRLPVFRVLLAIRSH